MTNASILDEEKFCLRNVLLNEPDLSEFVDRNLASATVVRRRSQAGFFATVTFREVLPETARAQWDWDFKHRGMSNGGSFICWREDPSALGLEAVAFDDDWPARFDPYDFSPA